MTPPQKAKFSEVLTEFLDLREQDQRAKGWLEEQWHEARRAELLALMDQLIEGV